MVKLSVNAIAQELNDELNESSEEEINNVDDLTGLSKEAK